MSPVVTPPGPATLGLLHSGGRVSCISPCRDLCRPVFDRDRVPSGGTSPGPGEAVVALSCALRSRSTRTKPGRQLPVVSQPSRITAMPETPSIVYGYLRVSSESQVASGLGLDAQLQRILRRTGPAAGGRRDRRDCLSGRGGQRGASCDARPAGRFRSGCCRPGRGPYLHRHAGPRLSHPARRGHHARVLARPRRDRPSAGCRRRHLVADRPTDGGDPRGRGSMGIATSGRADPRGQSRSAPRRPRDQRPGSPRLPPAARRQPPPRRPPTPDPPLDRSPARPRLASA